LQNCFAGRDFDQNLETDFKTTVIINQKLARSFGWNEPLGQTITVDSVRYSVAGVVEDFYNNSVWSPLKPVIFRLVKMMGLFALVSLNIARRTKEIGIRKVLGATMLHIMRLVNREFVSLLTAAAFIASVAGYFTVITDYWTLRSTFQSPWQDQLAATTAAIIFR
jgi:hypothetical protein